MAQGYAQLYQVLPVGVTLPYAGSSAPSGYLMCDGSAVSRTTYESLYAIIGTTFGTGDGSTTFNIPDLRGATPQGAGTSTGYTQNETVALGTKYDDQLQGHYHTIGSANLIYGISSGFGGTNSGPQLIGDPGLYVTGAITDGTNGVPRTGNVTKGKTVGMNWIIKT